MSDAVTTTQAKTATKPVKGAPVDPWEDPVKYLMMRGWKPEGNPRHPQCRWLDPTKPEKTYEEKVQIGTKKGPNNTDLPVYQTYVYPAAWPISMEEAIATQLGREAS